MQTKLFTFNDVSAGNLQKTTSLTAALGDSVYVRIKQRSPYAQVFLHVDANGVETVEEITDSHFPASLLEGHKVYVSVLFNSNESAVISGIMEVGQ
jgi:hypothetical protein